MLEADLKGKQRKFVVLYPEPDVYNVYWDDLYIGAVIPILDEDLGLRWTANNETLLGCAQEIGDYIESCDL